MKKFVKEYNYLGVSVLSLMIALACWWGGSKLNTGPNIPLNLGYQISLILTLMGGCLLPILAGGYHIDRLRKEQKKQAEQNAHVDFIKRVPDKLIEKIGVAECIRISESLLIANEHNKNVFTSTKSMETQELLLPNRIMLESLQRGDRFLTCGMLCDPDTWNDEHMKEYVSLNRDKSICGVDIVRIFISLS